MPIALGDAIVRILADSAELRKGLDSAMSQVQSVGAGMTKVGKTMTMGLTMPIVGVGVAAMKTAMDFDTSMRNMNAIAQLSEDQFVEMKEKVIDYSMTTRASSVQVANALTDIVAAGYEADDAFTVLTAASTAAGASMATVEQTSLALTATLASYRMEVSESSAIMDKFLQIVNLGRLDLPDLALSIGAVIPVAASMKISLDEVGAAMATMTNAGITTRMSAFQLKSVIVSLMKPTDELAAAIANYGYESGAALLEAEGLEGALRMMWDATEGESDRLLELLGNIRSVQGATILLREESVDYLAALEGMSEAEGAVQRAREQQYKSLSAQLKRFKGAIEVILITIGEQFIPMLVDLLENTLVPLARSFRELSPETIKLGTAIAIVVAAIGPLIWISGTLLTSLAAIQAAMAATTGATAVLGTAISTLLGPVGLIIAALGVLIGLHIKQQSALRSAGSDYLETAESAEEYADQLAKVRRELGVTTSGFAYYMRAQDEARETTYRAADTAEWYQAQLKETALDLKAQADEYANLRAYTEEQARASVRLTEVLEEEEAAVESLTLSIQDMEVSWFSNIGAIRDNVRAYEELRDEVISVGADTSATTARFQKDMARSEEDMLLKREELLKKHAEKRAWIESGDWERSKEEQAEAHGYWEAIMAEELAEFDAHHELKKTRREEDYNHQIATANAAAAEKARIAEEARQAELQAMREAQEELILLTALEMLEVKEWLVLPWGDAVVSAEDYFAAVSSGLVPVTDDIRNKLGGALELVRDSMREARTEGTDGFGVLQGILRGIIPDVMAISDPAMKSIATAAGTYVVQAGDTLAGLAQQWGTTVDEIVAVNENILDPSMIRVGEDIKRPFDEALENVGILEDRIGGLSSTGEFEIAFMSDEMRRAIESATEDAAKDTDDLRQEFEDLGRDGTDAADDIQREVAAIEPELTGVKAEVEVLASAWSSSFGDMCGDVKDLVGELEDLLKKLDEIPRKITIDIYYRYHGGIPTGAQHGFHGIVSGPMPLLVGEAGPEEVHVTPLRGRGRGLVPAGEGEGLTIIIQEPTFYGIEDFEEAVRDVLEEEVEGSRGFVTGGRG